MTKLTDLAARTAKPQTKSYRLFAGRVVASSHLRRLTVMHSAANTDLDCWTVKLETSWFPREALIDMPESLTTPS
jgi:hypothetical protein